MPQDQKQELLGQLRLEARHRPARASPPWGRIATLIAVVAVLVGVSVSYALLRPRPVTAHAQASSGSAPQAASSSDTSAGAAGAARAAGAAALQASGYVTARREATVSAQITGTLIAVPIQEGEHVKKGQVLARLDDSQQQAQVAQARAQLMAAEAQLAQYRAQLAEARLENQRNAVLIREKSVAPQAYDQSRAQVAELTAQVASERAQIALARASLQASQVQLDYTVVRAPYAGVIIAKNAQIGEIVSPLSAGGGFTRTGVATIVDMRSLEIDVDVDEAYIDRVHPRQHAVAVLDAYPDWRIPAHVIAIIPTADKSKGTVTVRLAIDLRDPRILPDMGVHVTLLEGAAGRSAHGGNA